MDWLGDNAWAIWLALALLLVIAEMVSLDFILVMLAGGALAGAASSTAIDGGLWQILIAALVSVLMLAVVRPRLVERMHNGPDLVVGHQRLIGREATVTRAITGLQVGQVSLAGELWTARPTDPETAIGEGAVVRVTGIEGATAVVTPVASS